MKANSRKILAGLLAVLLPLTSLTPAFAQELFSAPDAAGDSAGPVGGVGPSVLLNGLNSGNPEALPGTLGSIPLFSAASLGFSQLRPIADQPISPATIRASAIGAAQVPAPRFGFAVSPSAASHIKEVPGIQNALAPLSNVRDLAAGAAYQGGSQLEKAMTGEQLASLGETVDVPMPVSFSGRPAFSGLNANATGRPSSLVNGREARSNRITAGIAVLGGLASLAAPSQSIPLLPWGYALARWAMDRKASPASVSQDRPSIGQRVQEAAGTAVLGLLFIPAIFLRPVIHNDLILGALLAGSAAVTAAEMRGNLAYLRGHLGEGWQASHDQKYRTDPSTGLLKDIRSRKYGEDRYNPIVNGATGPGDLLLIRAAAAGLGSALLTGTNSHAALAFNVLLTALYALADLRASGKHPIARLLNGRSKSSGLSVNGTAPANSSTDTIGSLWQKEKKLDKYGILLATTDIFLGAGSLVFFLNGQWIFGAVSVLALAGGIWAYIRVSKASDNIISKRVELNFNGIRSGKHVFSENVPADSSANIWDFDDTLPADSSTNYNPFGLDPEELALMRRLDERFGLLPIKNESVPPILRQKIGRVLQRRLDALKPNETVTTFIYLETPETTLPSQAHDDTAAAQNYSQAGAAVKAYLASHGIPFLGETTKIQLSEAKEISFIIAELGQEEIEHLATLPNVRFLDDTAPGRVGLMLSEVSAQAAERKISPRLRQLRPGDVVIAYVLIDKLEELPIVKAYLESKNIPFLSEQMQSGNQMIGRIFAQINRREAMQLAALDAVTSIGKYSAF